MPSSYDWIPARMVVPAVPTLEDRPLDPAQLAGKGEMGITGLTTVPCETEAARREAEAMLGRCRERLRRGDRYAITDLLDANPAFIAVGWVAEELLRLRRGGLPLRRRGRICGGYRFPPPVVAGPVPPVIAPREGPGPGDAIPPF